ncbi:hypothetical protein [Ruminococcus sp.]|uniref:hypothetical protein n=1 Tax=Ruminococcus sp. TaxID=41978 RepID=UPI0034553E74|nr:hypothetical protein [Ruminococcus sp.]
MNKRRILTFITALTMGMTSMAFTPNYVVAEDMAPSAAISDEAEITDLSLIREMFNKFIEEEGLNITCAAPDKYPEYSDTVVIEFDMNEDDYIELLKFASANHIDRNSFTYMAFSNGVLMTTTMYDPTITTTTTTTKANNEYFSLMWKDYNVAVGNKTYIAYCGTARPESWTVDNEDVISLDESGLAATGLKPGKATITYKDRDVTVKAYVTVSDAPADVTTSTAVWTVPTTTVTTTQTVTTSVIYDFMPTVEFDTSPMKVGEVREGKFYNPETKKTDGGSVYAVFETVKVEYTEGGDTFKVTALEPGRAHINFGAKGCAFMGSVEFKVVDENGDSPTTTTTKQANSQTTYLTTATTTSTSTTTVIYDFWPTVEFDKSPMTAGETREGRFYNPETKKNEGGWVEARTDNISVEYTDGSDTFKVTALKAGEAMFGCWTNGCAFTGYVNIDIVEVSKEKGDANCDGQMDMSDVVLIMQSLANPNKYGENGTAKVHLTAQGKENADLDGNGLTVGDAQKIQMKLLGLDDDSEPLTPLAQSVGVNTTDEAIKLIRSYDLNDYNVNAHETMKQMFESFKKDGFIYRFAEVTGDDAVKLRDDYVNPPVWLGPYANFEDIGILYHVKAYDMNYQLYYFNRGKDYAGQSMSDYIKNRFGFNVTKVIDDKYFIFDSSKDGQNDISVIFALDDGHYCKVRCFGSEAELMKLAKSLKSVKLPLGEKKITDLNDVNALLIAYETEHKLPVSMITSISQGDKQVYVYLGTFDIKEQEKVIEQMKNYMKFMNIDEELVCFAIPQTVAD